MTYHQLTSAARYRIIALRGAGWWPTAIARMLRRHPSTFTRKRARNRAADWDPPMPTGPVFGGKVNVVWTMTDRNSYMAKGATLVMKMDTMDGGDFEKGLAQLKTISEAAVPAPLAARTP